MFVLVAQMAYASSDGVKPPTAKFCDLQLVNNDLYAGKPAEALAQQQRCLGYFQSQIGKHAGEGPGIVDVEGLNNVAVIGALYHVAQIYALSGDVDHADTALMQAEDFAASQGWLSPPGGMMTEMTRIITNTTKGFIRERRGETGQALEAYFSAQADGRISVIALAQKDDMNARLYAARAAVGQDPTGDYVLGSLAEISGDLGLAWSYYDLAQKTMQKSLSANVSPLYFSEAQKVNAALERIPKSYAQGHIEERNGHRSFIDSSGTVVGQERWPGTIMSEKVRRKQAEYNTWIETRTKEASLSNIRLVPQYPRQFLVVGASGALSADHAEITEIRVPRHIEPTGVLDLDTLAIGYYKSAIEWAELCKAAGADNQELTRPTKEEDFKERTPAAFKPALVWQLGHAYADLDRLRYFLSGVTLYTSAGKTYDAVGEAQTYEASLKLLKDSADAVQSDTPPDFITAHINPQQLTSAFIDELRSRESAIQAELFLAREIMSAKAP